MSAISNPPEEVIYPRGARLKVKQDVAVQIEHVENISEASSEETSWQLYDAPIENQRPIRVIVIGAGYSGVYCGIKFPERLKNCELVIYEKNDGIGGTWYENRYPGAACDIPSHSYQFSFSPKHDWSSLYAPSAEIRDYIQSTARKFGADRYIKLNHKVQECVWDQESGKWSVRVCGPEGAVFEDCCDVLISARGLLNEKSWPRIEGLERFGGEVMHSAAWKEEVECEGKRVGVVGSGSSAIQIIPKLQALPGTHLTCFIRSRTWISPPFGQKVLEEMGLGTDTLKFHPSQIARFASNPSEWFDFRLKIEADANSIHNSTLKGTPMQQKGQIEFEKGMRERLKAKKEYYDWLRPSFAPGCRRLTPGPGFLEALVQDNVDFIRDPISHITEDGIVTEDGREHPLDILVCATGFRTSAAPPFPITGLQGKKLSEHWNERATTYLSLATDSFPNFFFMLGPNGAIGEGSLTMMIESAGEYICRAIRKLQKENIKSLVVKPQRVEDFTAYADKYFEGTVYVDGCKSWYRQSPQGEPSPYVTGLWPGSTLHCIEALRSPRWEDYAYEYLAVSGGNQMAWLGNGAAGCQMKEEGEVRREELAWYLLRGGEGERWREWSY